MKYEDERSEGSLRINRGDLIIFRDVPFLVCAVGERYTALNLYKCAEEPGSCRTPECVVEMLVEKYVLDKDEYEIVPGSQVSVVIRDSE